MIKLTRLEFKDYGDEVSVSVDLEVTANGMTNIHSFESHSVYTKEEDRVLVINSLLTEISEQVSTPHKYFRIIVDGI